MWWSSTTSELLSRFESFSSFFVTYTLPPPTLPNSTTQALPIKAVFSLFINLNTDV